jgi:hypothetical protein
MCSDGVVRGSTGEGDRALCEVPKIACDPATDIQSAHYCHFAPSENPVSTCCAPRPESCAATDCECLLREGPWIDYVMAADAGTSLAAYEGPKWVCSYRVSCTPAPDGGVALIACNPA